MSDSNTSKPFPFTPLQKDWMAALESGEYQQGRNQLRSGDGTRFCCLGVAADIYLKQNPGAGSWSDDSMHRGTLPYHIRIAFGLRGPCGESLDYQQSPSEDNIAKTLSVINDDHGTFKDIVRRLRESPEQYFLLPDEIRSKHG